MVITHVINILYVYLEKLCILFLYMQFVLELRSCLLISVATLLGFTSVGEVYSFVFNITFLSFIFGNVL